MLQTINATTSANPNFSEQRQIHKYQTLIFQNKFRKSDCYDQSLKEKRNTQWFTTNSIQFPSEITFTTIKESNYKNQNRVYQFSQRRLWFECLNRNCHQISMSMHSGHSRIEFKWLNGHNLIRIMVQKQIFQKLKWYTFIHSTISFPDFFFLQSNSYNDKI